MPTTEEIKAKALHAARLITDAYTVTDNAALIGVCMAELLGVDPVTVRDAIEATRPSTVERLDLALSLKK